MADFARFIVAAEPNLPWVPGAFLAAYKEARMDAASITLEGDPFAEAIRRLVEETCQWDGTATALYSALNKFRDPTATFDCWPRNPKSASDRLRRLAPALRFEGIRVYQDRQPGGSRERLIHLARC